MTSPLDDLVRRTAQQLGVRQRGAIVVGAVRDGRSALHGADPGTLFEIGSVTKTFTALALARLTVRGAVRLDQPLRDLLPRDIRVPERGGEVIELAHLACHTSGLPRLPKGLLPRSLFRSDPYAGCTGEFLMDGLRRTRLRSVPGTSFRYSNLGAGLLGLVLARHTGTDYDSLVQAEICRPLGMTDTHVVLDQGRTARLAGGHSRSGRPRPPWHLAALAGAGGLHSTVPDLLTLARAQMGQAPDELAEAIALTHTTAHRINDRAAVHPGWISATPPGGRHRILFHDGGTGGYRSLLAVAPEARAAVVILNANARPVDRPGLDLLAQIIASGPDPDPAPAALGG
ncbi:serine hydrolase domain-containing protein [Streptomyces collinus]|uniref:Putative beta-lactamase n=1 Tax=Streptomyces collinus (strain DSM 40733 / Tue 365) TaxID=1214242 RepID=S5UTI4_STRC3|nr:serine hydrolase domain-containing protein [Streptomyces collinus]AGS69171.1 putative beta-lactamase [Streptomyces collinus Tu 365]UJA07808.1 penicillin-binding protein [Streptomyces collinus]UJA17326.1 penicillin-binding protein [Streptomyces collinus]